MAYRYDDNFERPQRDGPARRDAAAGRPAQYDRQNPRLQSGAAHPQEAYPRQYAGATRPHAEYPRQQESAAYSRGEYPRRRTSATRPHAEYPRQQESAAYSRGEYPRRRTGAARPQAEYPRQQESAAYSREEYPRRQSSAVHPQPDYSRQRYASGGATQSGYPAASASPARTVAGRPTLRYALISAVALIAVAVVLLLSRGGRDVPASSDDALQAQYSEASVQVDALQAESQIPSATPAPTPDPSDAVMAQRAAARPTPTAPGFLPVFRKGGTDEKIIAITVDDCYQAANLRLIVDKAVECGAKLTIFPIGENAIRDAQAEALKYAWENGCELENHTWSHNGLYRCSDEELAMEIYKQQLTLSYILGVEYQPHFLRPMGGDARHDQRLQKYCEQLGYAGIAHWSASGRVSNASLVEAMQPGQIFLFHTTDSDVEKLLKFIPYAIEQGWQLVTLNEMFGLPENETGALIQPVLSRPVPTIAPYERVLVPYKKTSYAWGVVLLQQKLIELGYLTGEPDGVYGDDSENAVKAWQRDHGLEATGVADVNTQQMIFSQ